MVLPPKKLQDYIEGDLMEVYARRVTKHGKRKADLDFIIDVLLLFRPSIRSAKSI
jgi:putative ABC transport system permease protein